MVTEMMTFTVISNTKSPASINIISDIISLLSESGCRIILNKKYESDFSALSQILYTDDEHLMFDESDFVIVVGGDGSIMHAAVKAAKSQVPVIGVNLGKLGYLAELEPSELFEIRHLINGDYEIDKRMLLDVKSGTNSFVALNDAVISRLGNSRIIDLKLYCGSEEVGDYRCDGLILTSPTGSTAYSMSAGGSIIDPQLECIGVTPICPMAHGSRPMVFSPDFTLTIKNVTEDDNKVILSVDGFEHFDIPSGSSVTVKKSSVYVKFARLKNNTFYKTLRYKISDR